MKHKQAQATTAEVVAGRELAQGNAGQPHRVRTPCRAALSRALARVRQAARDRARRVTARWPHGYAIDRRREADNSRKHEAAPGVEGQTWAAYGEPLDPPLREGSDRLQRGADQAPPVERVYRPQADGRQRPSGTPTLEDTIVQRATVEGRNALYETAWLGCSYGARPGRRPHHAWDAVTGGSEKRTINWVLDADMRGVYDAMEHAWRVKCVEHRLGDQRVVRHIRQWLRAGVLEAGYGRQQEEGTPPGGSARPLLANLYRHDVVDLWAAQWRRRHARGDVMIVRYGDEFSVGFQPKDDAEQCLSDLRERCPRCHRDLHPDQTRLSECGRWASARRQRRGQGQPETFDCLGCTHRCGTTKRGTCTGRRWTIAKRLGKQLPAGQQTLRERLHWPIEKLGAWLKRVVREPYRYDGVPRHLGPLWVFRARILRSWCRTIRRRRQRHRMTWQRMDQRATRWLPEPHILQPYPAQRRCVTTPGRSPGR